MCFDWLGGFGFSAFLLLHLSRFMVSVGWVLGGSFCWVCMIWFFCSCMVGAGDLVRFDWVRFVCILMFVCVG